MIGTRSVPAQRPDQETLGPLAVVDSALRGVGTREAIGRQETIELLGTVLAAAQEGNTSETATAIVNDFVDASAEAALIGAPGVVDALLDVRLALAGSPAVSAPTAVR